MTQEEKKRHERKMTKEYQYWLKTGHRHPSLDASMETGKRSRSFKVPVEPKKNEATQSSVRNSSAVRSPADTNATMSNGRVPPGDRSKSTSGRVSPLNINKNTDKRAPSSNSSKHKSNSERDTPSLTQKDRSKPQSHASGRSPPATFSKSPSSSSKSQSSNKPSSSSTSQSRDRARIIGNPHKFSFSHTTVEAPQPEPERPANAQKRKLPPSVERQRQESRAPPKKVKLGNPYLDRDTDFSKISTWDRIYAGKKKQGEESLMYMYCMYRR